ncbi:TIGR03016 family PEP-CTERM system-associated outer membrane protein [Pelomonas sp. SE-A7]|uniref:TIGR03016 family PEP-CTERM system-associated outer membrane protein n=1 Tax=Pelomonas sp. SE-A7 TaxID=3054953 RepID=UPI00259CE9AE|nr:TIGR03016 family PEP-CTERM system-associated outer membrane protein [Pelomonas sp. SE-A7]MDM4764870.1 TIGR03016 family PEP-CTERM system-associated outer membrane protein [Pelomonas sp. SE-A7]
MSPSKSEFGPFHLLTRLARAVCLIGIAGTACAQSDGGGNDRRSFSIQPSLSVSTTATDNLRLDDVNAGKDKAVVGILSPGLSLRANTGLLRGSLDYAMDGLMYYKTSYGDRAQHRLSSQGTVALWDGRFAVDMRATLGQQAQSAFGVAQSGSTSLTETNRSQLATLTISPRLMGQLGGIASYQLNATGTENRVKDSVVGDSKSAQIGLHLSGLGGSQRLLNWNLTGQAQRQTGGQTRRLTTEYALLGLSYRPDVDWSFQAQAGAERTNFVTIDPVTSSTYTVAMDWTPSPRTQLNADWRKHSYGNSHTLSFTHRMARSSWRFTDTQAVNGPGAVGASARQTNYALYDAIFTALEADPVKRDLLVRAYLQAVGLNADAISNEGFLAASATMTRAQSAAFSLMGLRSTVTVSINQSKTRRLDPLSQATDDLGRFGNVRLRSASLSLAHKLTTSNSISLTLADQRNDNASGSQSSDLKSLLGNFTGRLNQRLSYSLGLRHSRFNSNLRAYRENAATATLTQQF